MLDIIKSLSCTKSRSYFLTTNRKENRFTNGSRHRHSIVRRASTGKYYLDRRYTHINQQPIFIPRNNITNQLLKAQNPHPHTQRHPKLLSRAKPVKRIGNHNKYQLPPLLILGRAVMLGDVLKCDITLQNNT